MISVMGIEVSKAARELGISPQRVRSLLSSELLEGKKIAGRWFIDPRSIEHWEAQSRGSGRPFSGENAWGILLAASGQEAPWLSPWDRSRLRDRLSRDWKEWIPKVRYRASVRPYRAHPGQLKRLSKHPKMILSGVSAARSYGLDVIAREQVEGYVHENDFVDLIKKSKLSDSSNPNVFLHVIESKWPPGLDKQSRVMPPAVVALDLIESADPRSRRAGNGLLRRLRKEHRDHHR